MSLPYSQKQLQLLSHMNPHHILAHYFSNIHLIRLPLFRNMLRFTLKWNNERNTNYNKNYQEQTNRNEKAFKNIYSLWNKTLQPTQPPKPIPCSQGHKTFNKTIYIKPIAVKIHTSPCTFLIVSAEERTSRTHWRRGFSSVVPFVAGTWRPWFWILFCTRIYVKLFCIPVLCSVNRALWRA